jgi:hypothetical protein
MTNIQMIFNFCPCVLKNDVGCSSHSILYAGFQLLKIVFVLIHEARSHLNHSMPGRWISRSVTIAWLPRSPDLTALDIFLWGYVRNLL